MPELGDGVTVVRAEGDELLIDRTFAAPRELVWRVMTEASHVARWLGPHGTPEILEFAVSTGMARGIVEPYEKLATLLEEIR